MKTIFNTVHTALNHLSRYAAVALTAASLTACVMEDGECPAVSVDKGIGVSLEIAGGLPAASTRAEEEEGSLAESYIDINDLYVFSFDFAEGETVASDNAVLKDIIWSPDQSGRLEESVITSNGTDVIITTFLDSEKYSEKDLDFCIVTVANASEWTDMATFYPDLKPGETTLGNLQKTLNYNNVIFHNNWAPDNGTGSGIPLFGIRKVNLSKYDTQIYSAANPYPLGTVWLLRSLAKIEISTDEDSGLEIEQAWIESGKWNTGFQLIPSPLSRMENYDTTGETAQVTTAPNFDAHEFNPDPAESELIFIKNEETGSHVVYLPEYDLRGNPQIIKLKIQGYTGTFPLSVSPYTEGVPGEGTEPYWKCILRNHLYRFQITGIEEDATLSLNWTVCPMVEYTTDIPDFQ